LGGILVISGLFLGGGTGLAHDDAHDATPEDAAAAHPAHIHTGTCDTLGEVVFPLNDVAAPDHDAQGEASTEYGATATPEAGEDKVVAESTTTVEVALDDILAVEHAVNVHESAENIGNYIACGDVTGEPEDGAIEIELLELNDSGYSGQATLVDDGDGATTVTITLTRSDDAGTPEASAGTDAAATADAVTVEISDFAYGPETVTIPVGGSVTFTNLDTVPHTATAQDRDVLQTGTLGQDESVTITFDEAGTYEYFCEFHPNMSGTVIVE
jgi:plastocyanin